MTVLYSNDFESLTHLATIPAFTSTGGGNFIALGPTFAPAPAARGSFRYGAPDNGDQNYWNGNTALTSMAIRHATKILSGASVAHLLRYNTSTGACYRCYYEWDNTNLRGTIAKWDGGSTAGTQQSGYTVACASGDTVHMESRVVGSTIELRLWTNGNPRPSTPTVTMTDSSYTTGAAGLRRVFGNTTYANVDDLVITDAAGGEDFFYAAAAGPTINTQPANQTVTAGGTATFSVTATASGGSLSYQWQRNGTNISGAMSASYTTPATTVTGGTANNGDVFRCVVTDSNGSVNSSGATLTVNAAAAGPTINTQPVNQTVTAGSTATFSVAATASGGPLSYQWQRSTNSGGSWSNVTTGTGGTTSSYTTAASTVSGGTANNADQYRCAVTDSNGTVNTSAATLTVNAAAGVVSGVVKNNTGSVLASTTFPKVTFLRLSDMTVVLNLTNQVSDSNGILSTSNAALTTGTAYLRVLSDATGANVGIAAFTAS